VQVLPNGRFVYMNNRGEDTIVWFSISADGHLKKAGSVSVSKSDDPAGATRCMTLSPQARSCSSRIARRMSYGHMRVDANDGSLKVLTEVPVQTRSFVQFVEL